MKKRRLGKTELMVSPVGFGGIPIQRLDEDLAYDLLKEAYENGMNFIDTARGYMESEALLGSALEKIGRDKFIIATKSMSRTYEGVKEEFETSLKNLRTDHIELFQFHNIRTEAELKIVMGENGAYRAIKEYQDKGIIGSIGVTSHSTDFLDAALDTDFFSTIQYPYNPVERQGEGVFKKARSKDIGVIVMKPLAGGAIPKGELCIRFILENEDVTVAIPGMESVDQIRENIKPAQDGQPLTDEERAELLEEASTLGEEFCRRCGYCAPCTVGIDIPGQFIIDGYYTRYNLQNWAKSRYEGLEIKASDCIECGICEAKCPYDLPIIKMMNKVESHFEA
nr:aldo/keto reductase [Tissierella sp.]